MDRYDFDREHDKDFLREAGKLLQEKVLFLEIEIATLRLQQSQDEEIKKKLAGELLVLRQRIFDSKQEKKERLKKLKDRKKKKKTNLLHNQNANKNDLESEQGEQLKLSSEEIEHELDSEKRCSCCSNGEFEELKGLFDESCEYDVKSTFYILKRHKRKKYKCKSCQKMMTAPGPEKLTPGAQFSIQMAVQIACDKYQYHIPLERQRVKMRQAGVDVSVKTLYSLTAHLYNNLCSLEEMNRQDILEGDHVCLDESPIPFFNPEKSKGYAWTLSNNIGAHYQFEPTRSGEVAREMVQGFQGIVVSDAYGGYTFLDEKEGITHAYCWAHVRRYFFQAAAENERASEVVDLIDQLYATEHESESYEDLAHQRNTKSRKIVGDIDSWTRENEQGNLPSSLTGKAINYFKKYKNGLLPFLEDPLVPLDNNAAERRQRCPVMGRKNFLAFRSINGADVGMFFYSIIESGKTNGLSPSAYLQDMALRQVEDQKLESPYQYACRLKKEISKKLTEQLVEAAIPS